MTVVPFSDPLREARRIIGEELLAMQQCERRLIAIANDIADLRGEMRASRERLIEASASLARAAGATPTAPETRLFGSVMRPDADPMPLSQEDKA